jgi:ATP-binding protein involved in chromosome partitioning
MDFAFLKNSRELPAKRATIATLPPFFISACRRPRPERPVRTAARRGAVFYQQRGIFMVSITRQQVEQALRAWRDPYLDKDLLLCGAVEDIAIDGADVRIHVTLGYPAAGVREQLRRDIAAAVAQQLPAGAAVEVALDWRVVARKAQQNLANMQQVKNIIAVASGKGGVGKSTTAVNLALALALEGARVGLLDADIYGPSQPIMLGVPAGQRPNQRGAQLLEPILAHGLQTMSIGYLLTDNAPVVWRGPMVSGALQQLLNQTAWEDLDYLIIDLPPGTGDIQLTLAQKVPVAGAVIVTTPQDIALLDARKGIDMFHKVDVPVLGIVENMAVHICSNCGHQDHLFGSGGGAAIAADYGVPLLGSLPLARSIREQADGGNPTVAAEPDGPVAAIYREIARRMAAHLALRERQQEAAFPNIVIKND